MTPFDLSKSEQYDLSIRLSADGFSFSVHHPQDNGGDDVFFNTYPVNASYSLTANVKEMIASTEALKHSFRKTNILMDTPRFTPVPFDLYEDEPVEAFFHHNFPKENNEIILCNILGKSNVALLFGMDKHAHQLLNEHFASARFFACVSPLTEHFTLKSRDSHCRNIYAHLKKETLEVFAFDDKGQLLLINTFGAKQTADKVYYLLFVWKQLGFSQEHDRLWMVGETDEELSARLRKFLRQVSVLPQSNHLPFDIQTLMTCE